MHLKIMHGKVIVAFSPALVSAIWEEKKTSEFFIEYHEKSKIFSFKGKQPIIMDLY